MPNKMPVLFIGHGSPMNAIEDNKFNRGWSELARKLPKPKAILCISAHWETNGVFVTAAEKPETIHDFGGFPQALFDVQYKAPGSPELARRVVELVKSTDVQLDTKWGLDHGAWSVLLPMYPDADIPVVQLSLDRTKPSIFHYTIAKELAPLRDEGILIIGSGDIVHNLRLLNFNPSSAYDWSTRFNDEVKNHIISGQHEALIDYKSFGQDADFSVPTPEHYLPLLYTIALQENGDKISFFNDVVVSSISMTSVMISHSVL
jgi:4,5-DOPA dioxygenase extradiol